MPATNPRFAAYLSFNGNCQPAFRFYQACLGGVLQIQTLADCPGGDHLDGKMQQLVVSATLSNRYITLVGTDLNDAGPLVPGNRIALLIFCKTWLERARLVNRLLERNGWSPANRNPLMNITDKFHVNWIVSIK